MQSFAPKKLRQKLEKLLLEHECFLKQFTIHTERYEATAPTATDAP